MDWHSRYMQQASWTRPLRDYLLNRSGMGEAKRVLEVGCGTGAVLLDVAQRSGENVSQRPRIHGLDIQAQSLNSARRLVPEVILTQGDAHRLPFADRCFDVTLCHFLLMWLSDPALSICEMGRVTKTAGHVLALAEPDYSARLDLPVELAVLGQLQQQALAERSADPSIGSRLAELFDTAGLKVLETGTIGARDSGDYDETERQSEWAVLREDLSGQVAAADLDRLEEMDSEVRRTGQRTLYVPTFFVHAQV